MESILVLEDDDDLRDIVSVLLVEQAYSVVAAGSATEALDKARQQSFHLILSDVRMAGSMDGVAVIEQVQRLQPHIRSIVMTGYADLDVPIRAARIRADDYLLKPFETQSLLSAVRAVLEKETPFRGLFSRLADVSSEVAQKARRWIFDSHLSKLNQIRELCFKRFYLLIRSGRRPAGDIYPSFCRLERLELEYFKANQPQQWNQLAEKYLALEESLLGPVAEKEQSSTLTWAEFKQLFDKIQRGQLESCHLEQSILLLHDPEARKRDVESYSTYHWLWSEPRKERDPFEGLKVEQYVLQQLRSADNPRARLYDAVIPGQTEKGDVVLCLPVDEESGRFLHQELQTGRWSVFNQSQGHYFLVYPGEALSLARRVPPEGFPPARAWAVLKPVFKQVYLHHQQGRCCGSFSLSDIEIIANQPQLYRFDTKAFRKAALDIREGRIWGCVQTAPEAAYQAEPTLLSDQFVLGQILYQMLVGQSAQEVSALYLMGLGSAEAESTWSKIAPRLGVLAPVIYRLCQSDPTKRYPDLRQAAVALDHSLACLKSK